MRTNTRLLRFSGAALAAVMVTASTARAQTPPPTAAAEAKQEVKQEAKKAGNAMTDGWITLKVHSQFIPEKALDDSDIDVDTKHGNVTLNGTVASAAGREKAIAIAKATDGVKYVTDNLRIVPAETMTGAIKEGARDTAAVAKEAARTTGTTGKEVARETGTAGKEVARDTANAAKNVGKRITDGWVKSKIAMQFVTEDTLDNSDIDIDITKGAVSLNGTVRSDAGRIRAVTIAKATDGVKSVVDNLKIVP